jgi:ribosome biogenesis GTPase
VTGEEGLVVAHFGVEVEIRLGDGQSLRRPVRRRSDVVVGDRALVGASDFERLERETVLRRRDVRGRIRAIAANLDVLGIVVAPSPQSPAGYLDRGVVAARAARIEPFVVANKRDLEGSQALVVRLEETYSPAIPVFSLSAGTGEGLEALCGFLSEAGRGAFIGTSGVGKSSLLNALCPGLELKVGALNTFTRLGRHVTSNSTLHRLAGGGELIDTPGFRDFVPVELSRWDLSACFPGLEAALAEPCRFRDCAHRSEPGCRVLEGVAAGQIAAERHRAYLAILADLEPADARVRRRR